MEEGARSRARGWLAAGGPTVMTNIGQQTTSRGGSNRNRTGRRQLPVSTACEHFIEIGGRLTYQLGEGGCAMKPQHGATSKHALRVRVAGDTRYGSASDPC